MWSRNFQHHKFSYRILNSYHKYFYRCPTYNGASLPRRSSFGRTIRRPVDLPAFTSDLMADDDSDDVSVAFHFENELDLIALLVYKDIIRDGAENGNYSHRLVRRSNG